MAWLRVPKNRYCLAFALMLFAFGNTAQSVAQSVNPALVPTPKVPKVAIKDILKVCFECHGDGGISSVPSRPTIAGQKGNYLARELKAFQKAARKPARDFDNDAGGVTKKENESQTMLRANPVMQHMVKGLNIASITKLSAVLSKMACRKDKTKIFPKSAPAITKQCILCHGKTGIATQKNAPHLAGQRRSYLRRQLLLIRESAWGATPRESENLRTHPIMESQVARLSIEQVDALAEYYSSQDCRGPTPK